MATQPHPVQMAHVWTSNARPVPSIRKMLTVIGANIEDPYEQGDAIYRALRWAKAEAEHANWKRETWEAAACELQGAWFAHSMFAH